MTMDFIKTGIGGLDDLLGRGMPVGSNVLLVGGPGSGKTLMCLQMGSYLAGQGKKCLYVTLVEEEDRIKEYLTSFGDRKRVV